MSQKNVELIIGKLATDEEFRGLFRRDPEAVLAQLAEGGLLLTAAERSALTLTDVGCCETFAEKLDPRLQKASLKEAPLRKTVAAALLAVAAMSPLRADEPVRPLSLEEAITSAVSRNHAVSIDRESLRFAAAQVDRASGPYDPALSVEARYREHRDPLNSIFSGAPAGELSPKQSGIVASASLVQLLPTGGTVALSTSVSRDHTNALFTILSPSYSTLFGLEVRQPLLQNFRIDAARRILRVARTERDRSAAALERSLADTVAAVERAYWTLVAARRDVEVRRSSVGLAEEQRTDTQARIEAGTLPESDQAQTVAEVERRRGELFAAEENARRAEHQLKSLILDDAADPLWNDAVTPAEAPDPAPRAIALADALRSADERRAELREANALVARQDVELTAARNRLLPQLDVVGAYARRGLAGTTNPNAISFNGDPVVPPAPLQGSLGRSFGTIVDNEFPDASIGLALTLPIGNRTAKADIVAAEASRRQAQLALAQTRQRVAVEVRNAALALSTAAQRLEAARAGRAAAETQLNAERERFSVGLSTNFFVLTRQNELAQAQLTETAALTDYQSAATEIARSTGTLLNDRNIQIGKDAPVARADGGIQ